MRLVTTLSGLAFHQCGILDNQNLTGNVLDDSLTGVAKK
jgi:hypothetical protein